MGNRYSEAWDDYTKFWNPNLEDRQDVDAKRERARGRSRVEWPGDEWGSEKEWAETIEHLMEPAEFRQWRRVIEIGQGSGKYTIPVLANSQSEVKGFDVSGEFLKVCARRCADYIDAGRLTLHHILSDRPRIIQEVCEEAGWTRSVDALFSIDAMVHVDLNCLASYFLAASEVLREGGWLVMTLADVSSDAGFEKLISELNYTFTTAGQSNRQFEWLHPELIRNLVTRFGFSIVKCETRWRDLELVARLDDTALADGVRNLATESSV